MADEYIKKADAYKIAVHGTDPNGKDKIVTRQGKVISCTLECAAEQETGTGYIPHWSTCPAAGQFKRMDPK